MHPTEFVNSIFITTHTMYSYLGVCWSEDEGINVFYRLPSSGHTDEQLEDLIQFVTLIVGVDNARYYTNQELPTGASIVIHSSNDLYQDLSGYLDDKVGFLLTETENQ